MREIKFRYIIELPADFVQKGDPIKTIVEYHTLEDIERGLTGLVNHTMVRILSRDEYIGAQDNQNQEIYEGDVVKDRDGEVFVVEEVEVHGLDGRSYVGWNVNVMRNIVNSLDGKQNEVIGNITQNPELLK